MKKRSFLVRLSGALCLFLACVSILTPRAAAQQFLPLLTWTNAWRYDQSGTDLGTAWRESAFDDSSWPAGLPIFGVELGVPFPYAAAGFNSMTTPLDLIGPGQSAQTITYYFRTHFNFPWTNLTGVVLTATAYADDGCVLYLNGSESGRARISPGQNWQTLTTTTATEGAPDVFTLPAASLRAGDNVLAVEVHQVVFVNNSDVAFALSLAAALPQPLVITNQPRSQTIIAGTQASFSVGVSGAPVSYQWRTNGISIPGATTASFSIARVQLINAGIYSVVASNALGTVVSDNAVLSVIPDNFGPHVLAANVTEDSPGSAPFTNHIQLVFSESPFVTDVHSPLAPAILTNGTFQITLTDSNLPVGVIRSVYKPGGFPLPGTPPTVVLNAAPTNWHRGSNYFVTLNHIRDLVGNVIAPDTRIPVSWPHHGTLIELNATWDFHAAAVFEPDIFSQNWASPDFIPGSWWAQGVGPFCAGPVFATPCLGSPQTEVGFQPEPLLFRIPFVWTVPATSAILEIDASVDDGVIFYLNGIEVARNNVSTNVTTVTASTRSQSDVGSIVCQTNTVTASNLVPGTNWLAAAVVSSSASPEGVAVFACRAQATWLEPTTLPPEPLPHLAVQSAGTNAVTLSWTGSGFTLETATNLHPSPAPWR